LLLDLLGGVVAIVSGAFNRESQRRKSGPSHSVEAIPNDSMRSSGQRFDSPLFEKRQKTAALQKLAHVCSSSEIREASWSAPALWRFGTTIWQHPNASTSLKS
jgi:hypothetical protein